MIDLVQKTGVIFDLVLYLYYMNLNEQINRIKEMMGILNEASQHVENLYKSWATKKSGNPEMAMKIMNDVLDNQKKLPKKDFSQYSSYDELVSDLNKLKQDAKSEDASKIYEDKDLLVIAANTWEASCKYGAGSKWCTTARDDSSYWKRHNETGTEFFWIFKNKPQNDPGHKFSYHIKVNGDHDWCNAINYCKRELPNDSYPKQHPMYDQIISKLNEFHSQRGISTNYEKSLIVSNWVNENIVDLLSEFDMKSYYNEVFDEQMYFFNDESVYDIVPLNGDINDEEYMEEFYDELTNHMENYNPPFNLDDFIANSNIIDDFIYLVNQTPELYESIINNAATPENVIDVITDDYDVNGINEIFIENFGIYCNNLIGFEASNFALKY
jgi:hypothetical protein